MWLVMNEHDPYSHLQTFLKRTEKKMKTIKCKYSKSEGYYQIRVIDKATNHQILSGTFADPNDQGFSPDPNVGSYVTFQATCEKGIKIFKTWYEHSAMPGFMALIPHSRIEKDIYPGYKVVSVTGMGNEKDRNSGLATRFLLLKDKEEIARCHMTYRDGSYDPSLGPTIETIAVKQSHRGQGLGKVLWFHVKRFIEANFPIECLNTDAPLKHIMVKATQVNTTEVEIRKEKDGSTHSMTFKEFLYDYCGFSVREQKGMMAAMLGGRRIKDEEAVLYIPMPSTNAPSAPDKEPKPGKPVYREKLGTRMCQWCSDVGIDKLRCGRCAVALYCNAQCQKKYVLTTNSPRGK